MSENPSFDWLGLLGVIAPVVSVLITWFLGRQRSLSDFSKEQMKHRYETFYVPFFARLYAGSCWQYLPSDRPFELRSIFLDMLTSNLALLGPRSQAVYPEVMAAHVAMLEYNAGNSRYKSTPRQYDRAFMHLEKALISEARDLSRKLRLTPITQTYERLLQENRRLRSRALLKSD